MKSKEAEFLVRVFSKIELPKHPILAIIAIQAKKLVEIIDSNPQLQDIVRRTLSFIQQEWRDFPFGDCPNNCENYPSCANTEGCLERLEALKKLETK